MNAHKQQWERGQSFVEASIGIVVLVIILGGLFDVGRAFLILTAVESATGEGALYGASHPECLTSDYASSICQASMNQTVVSRVREEGKPVVTINEANVTVQIEGSGVITAGSVLRVDVIYRYSPITPLGFMLWGSTAEVRASARQQIMSPPPPGYRY
jgi:Flp pilus assembly protein TadG